MESNVTVISGYQYLKFTELCKLEYWDYYLLNTESLIKSNYPILALKHLISQRKGFILISNTEQYKRCRVQLHARGIVLRDVVHGEVIKTKKQQICKNEDFLVAEIDAKFGGYGIVPETLEGAIVSGHYFLYEIDKSQLLPQYLGLLIKLKQFSNQVRATGSTNYAAIRPEQVLTYKIPLPPIKVQTELVENYNSKLNSINKYNQLLEDYHEAKNHFLNSFFGIRKNKIVPRKSFELVEFKNIDKWGVSFAAYQSRWTISPKYKQLKIGSICKIGSGGTPEKGILSYFNGTIPWVKTTEVINEIIISTEEHISEDGLRNSSAKIYPAGSLIIAMYGQGLTRGRTAKLGLNAATNQACAVLYEINNSIILTDFLWIYLMNEYDRLREMASGNNQPNLNAGMIYNYKIQIPPINDQLEIIKKVKEINKQISILKLKVFNNKENSLSEFANLIYHQP